MTSSRVREAAWDRLVEEEPRLADLLAEARTVKDEGGAYFCANQVWYGYGDPRRGFKARLLPLVGWERNGGPSLLTTPQAYDVGYQTIYDALPDCRGDCGCA